MYSESSAIKDHRGGITTIGRKYERPRVDNFIAKWVYFPRNWARSPADEGDSASVGAEGRAPLLKLPLLLWENILTITKKSWLTVVFFLDSSLAKLMHRQSPRENVLMKRIAIQMFSKLLKVMKRILHLSLSCPLHTPPLLNPFRFTPHLISALRMPSISLAPWASPYFSLRSKMYIGLRVVVVVGRSMPERK